MNRKLLWIALGILTLLAFTTAGFATYTYVYRVSVGATQVPANVTTTGTHIVEVVASTVGTARAYLERPPFDEPIAEVNAANGACDRNSVSITVLDSRLRFNLEVLSFTSGKAKAYVVDSGNLSLIPNCLELD